MSLLGPTRTKPPGSVPVGVVEDLAFLIQKRGMIIYMVRRAEGRASLIRGSPQHSPSSLGPAVALKLRLFAFFPLTASTPFGTGDV